MRRVTGAGLFLLAALSAWACGGHEPRKPIEYGLRDPIEYGLRELSRALAAEHCSTSVALDTVDEAGAQAALDAGGVVLVDRPESFAVLPAAPDASGPVAHVVGRDAVGAMYGALELAERIRADHDCALGALRAYARVPAVPIRGANLFLVLPVAGESRWWFRDLGFWSEYLDLLAHSRINFLDLHGMYDPRSTIFPNALLYFANSASFPGAGVPAAEREENLSVLKAVIAMAEARGVRVGLMSYRSDLSVTGTSAAPALDERQIALYIREAAEDLARRAPGLWRLGFRIGESGHAAQWYADTFIAGVRAAGTGVGVYTRTWLSSRPAVMSLVRAAANEQTIVEVKYNGEHLGAPYPIAGGMFRDWAIYSYEDYLDPPAPYQLVFQVRAGGTHRIFRYASYERTRRMVPSFTMAGARGFSLEATHAYFPQRDYFHTGADRFSEWTFRRDELQYLLFGRLAYDPATDEGTFRAALRARVGTETLWSAVQAASEIVPWIQTANTCGPDHRDFAPDLEWGGTVGLFALPPHTRSPGDQCGSYHGPFDSFAVASPYDTGQDLIAGRETSRLSALEVARLVLDAAARARTAAAAEIAPENAEARDFQRECIALADLGDYFGHKLRGATALAVYAASGSADYLAAARAETRLADDAWRALASDTDYIIPFEDRLRMTGLGLNPFHWSKVVPWLARDSASIDMVVSQVTQNPPPPRALPDAVPWLDTRKGSGPGLQQLHVEPLDGRASQWTVSATFEQRVPPQASVNILWKAFPATATNQWQSVPAAGKGKRFTATIAGGGRGALFAVEVVGPPGSGWRYPNVLKGTPYVVLAP